MEAVLDRLCEGELEALIDTRGVWEEFELNEGVGVNPGDGVNSVVLDWTPVTDTRGVDVINEDIEGITETEDVSVVEDEIELEKLDEPDDE